VRTIFISQWKIKSSQKNVLTAVVIHVTYTKLLHTLKKI